MNHLIQKFYNDQILIGTFYHDNFLFQSSGDCLFNIFDFNIIIRYMRHHGALDATRNIRILIIEPDSYYCICDRMAILGNIRCAQRIEATLFTNICLNICDLEYLRNYMNDLETDRMLLEFIWVEDKVCWKKCGF